MKRGVKALIKNTAPGKFVRGKFAGFRVKGSTGRATGTKLRGITKLLGTKLYSKGEIQYGKGEWRGEAWKGEGGGLRRGKAVDAQVSRLCQASEATRRKSQMLKFTRLVFSALKYHDLVPIGSQRVVLHEGKRLATAVDIVCTRGENELVLVELKCGFHGDRATPTFPKGNLKGPLRKAVDCALHRHLAQLATTTALFERETGTLRALRQHGVTKVGAALLYVSDEGSELHELAAWWRRRGAKILDAIG
tara:strand:- start:455 stop:1201 length:747 start_codon:yes stop_codon:yes gene_type:complete